MLSIDPGLWWIADIPSIINPRVIDANQRSISLEKGMEFKLQLAA